jgi:hypothetical protein
LAAELSTVVDISFAAGTEAKGRDPDNLQRFAFYDNMLLGADR